MRRRSFLAAATGTSLGAVGLATGTMRVDAHTPTGGTPPDSAVDRSETAPLGRLELPDAAEAVVGPDGTTVYVATMDGCAVVDTSDQREPALLARVEDVLAGHEHGPMATIQDVKVDGDRLLVVGPAHRRDVVAAAVVYDVSDPANPERVGVHETDYPIHNAFLADDLAYLTGNGAEGNPLVVVDVAGDPTERGRWSLFDVEAGWEDVASSLRVVHDVWVQDGLAYLAHWDAGTWIVDVSDPETPEAVARVRGRNPGTLAAIGDRDEVLRESTELPGNDHFVTVNDDATLLGVGVEAWDYDGDGEGAPGGIELYDVTDTSEPSRVGAIDPPPTPDPARDGVWTTAHNFELTADHCYSSWYQGGVRVHDVSDPSSPTERYFWRDQRTTRFWTARRASRGETFVASSMGVDGADEGDVPDAVAGTATTTPEDGAGGGPPGLYVFPDPVAAPTETAPGDTGPADGTGTGEGAERTDGGPVGAVGHGFGPLAALAAIGGLAVGLRPHVGEE